MSSAGSWALILVRTGLGALLFFAGFTKLGHAYECSETIANFMLLPAQANQFLAVALPWCEVIIGVLLVFGMWARAAALLSALLFAGFSVAVISALTRGLDIDCGCFGTTSAARVGIRALALDVGALLSSLAVLRFSPAS
jgi:putative oxidoreductase